MQETASTTPKELEVKLEVDPTSLPALTRIPLFRTLKLVPTQSAEVSVYFDTHKQTLRKKGLMLRVRRKNGRYIQTIKASSSSGPFERDEWETEIARKEPDLSQANGTALEPLLSHKLRRRLKPLFETRVRRTVYPVVDEAHAVALTVDRGTLDTGSQSLPLCEIELDRGTVAELFDVARQLVRALPARLALKSKSERGYEIIDGELETPVKATPIDLPAGASTRDAFKMIGLGCLKQIINNEAALIGGNPEGVHQMRVGLRRLRAAMSLFAILLPDPQTAAVKTELNGWRVNLGQRAS